MIEIFSKIKKFGKPASLTIGLLVIAGLILQAQVLAVGPEFNIFPISYTGETNHDFPLLDARNQSDNGSFSQSQSDHNNGVHLDPGETVEFVVYYHNGAVDSDENVAKNVRIRADLPSGLGFTHTVSATISADNAATVSSAAKGGDMQIHISGSEEQRLEYIAGSTRLFPDHGGSSQSLPDGIVSGGINIGDIRGCWNFSGFVKFRARVTADFTEDGFLEIDKMVSNRTEGTGFRNSVDAEPFDTVEFRIEVEARNGDVEDVIVRDILPSGISFVSGSLRINGTGSSGTRGLFGSGVDVGDLQEFERLEIRFEVEVASDSFFDNRTRILTNTANARGRNTGTVQDTADLRVEGEVLGSSFRLSKSAFNQTQGINAQSVIANAGDIINYTLTYSNTGGTTQRNVIIEDDLFDVLQLSDLINDGGGNLSGSIIRYDSITVPAQVSIDKTFQVRVRQISSNEADLVMTNFYGNQIDVQVRPPVVKGTFIAPKSGPVEWVVPMLALLFTGGLYLRKKYPQLKLSFLKKD